MDFETLAAAGYFFPYLCTELNISYFLALFFSIPLTEYRMLRKDLTRTLKGLTVINSVDATDPCAYIQQTECVCVCVCVVKDYI
jgi:hypothetical protein